MSLARRSVLALVGAATLFAAACGGSADAPSKDSESKDAAASVTVTEGKLTIATGEPAYHPWVENDAPESGEGFEAAVAYAVAEEMGYAKEDVVWVRTSFDAAIAPGPKTWDVNLQQFSITEERKKAVDFSSAYYTTTQAVLTSEGTKAASATSIADLKDVQFGVQTGTSSQKVLSELVAPNKDVMVFNNSVDVVQALKNGQIEAMVTDLPQTFYLAAAEIEKGKIVGQFPDSSGDEFAFVLPKGSKLTADVTKAVDALKASGKLAEIEAKWLSESVDVPVLQ